METIQLPKLKKIDTNQPKKKKILLLSDDLRLHSGIGTQSKELVLSTLHKYDWVQLGAAANHPDHGKIFELSHDVESQLGIKNAYLRIYANTGYGDPDTIRRLMVTERPDAIVHFTDPRYWGWLYNMEMEIRQQIPIIYWAIWDDGPDPNWNAPFYGSCDMILSISKQSYGIHHRVLRDNGANVIPIGLDSESDIHTNGYPEIWG